MNRDYYYFREAFLSLREEYLKNKKMLSQLKEYVVWDDKKINDFYFYLYYNSNMDVVQLWLSLEENKKNLFSFLKKHIKNDMRSDCLVTKNDSNVFSFEYNYFDLEFNNQLMFELGEKINLIINSDFAKNMVYDSCDKKGNNDLSFSLSKIVYETSKYWFDYYCYDNDYFSLVNKHSSNNIMRLDIFRFLDRRIPKECFNSYHKQIIEGNKDLKEIEILDDYFRGGYAELTLTEKNGKILCKTKEKNKMD